MTCRRCNGKGEVPQTSADNSISFFPCPVCLGLGAYEENPKYTDKPELSHTSVVVHSNLKIEDVLALLPQRGDPT